MGKKRIGENTADDSHGCIFAELVYNIDDVTKFRGILVSRYF